MPGPILPTPKPDEEPEGYFEVALLPKQRLLVLAALRVHDSKTKAPSLHKQTLQELELARKIDLALPRPQNRLDWDDLEKRAQERGSSIADLFFDTHEEAK